MTVLKGMIRKFFSQVLIAAAALAIAAGGAHAASNIPTGDIGNYGTWATQHNLEKFAAQATDDITQFQSEFQAQLVKNYVPAEAKIGLAFMNALNRVADVLDNSLVRFVNIFIVVMFLFWVMLEAYNLMSTGGNIRKLVESIAKKAILIVIWIVVLEQGPAQIFMWVMGPIISVGTILSDMILNAVAQSAGAQLPDTCAAIHAYAAAHTAPNMLIDAQAAAELMCVPTRLSGFFYTAVAAGWKWMLAGIMHSMLTFVVGAIFVVVFVYNIWKFALMALGVIADLFLAVMMLPLTAVAETTAQTSYKGIVGNIFNSFLKLFNVESLQTQIQRFIDAAIYFVSLSVVIALCAAILSGTITTDLSARIPTINDTGFVITLLTGLLVAYLANQSDKIAKNLGGRINASMGTQFGKDVSQLWKDAYGTTKSWWKAIREN